MPLVIHLTLLHLCYCSKHILETVLWESRELLGRLWSVSDCETGNMPPVGAMGSLLVGFRGRWCCVHCAVGISEVWILFLYGAEHKLTDITATDTGVRHALICTLVFCGRKKPELRYALWGVHPSCETRVGNHSQTGRGYSSFKLSIFREDTSYKNINLTLI